MYGTPHFAVLSSLVLQQSARVGLNLHQAASQNGEGEPAEPSLRADAEHTGLSDLSLCCINK